MKYQLRLPRFFKFPFFRLLSHLKPFLKLVLYRFFEDEGLKNAAALSYTTTLSIVPLMTVLLAVFSAFPVADKLALEVQSFIFNNFVPASSEVLEQYFQEFSKNAARLPGMGAALLVVIALMLISSINDALNRIWRVQKPRRILAQFLVYWSMLTLGPIFIGLSVAASSYFMSLPLFETDNQNFNFHQLVIKILPLLSSFVAFSLMYSIVPNRKVPFIHAFLGGLFSASLFELAKYGFAFYLTNFPTYQAIYGTLAIVPIFLVWVYLSWVITLLGAEFTYCLSLYWHYHERDKVVGDHLLDIYRIIKILREAQVTGDSVSLIELSRQVRGLPEERIETLLLVLQRLNLVITTEYGSWVLAQDLSHVSLNRLYLSHPWVLPSLVETKYTLVDEARLICAIDEIEQMIDKHFEHSLEWFLKEENSVGNSS